MEHEQQIRARLRLIHRVAVLDAVLLLLLVIASAAGERGWVSVLGPLHGGNFLVLLVLAGAGAADELWPWWFPGLVLVTAGPPGSWIGRRVIERRMAAKHADGAWPASTEEAR